MCMAVALNIRHHANSVLWRHLVLPIGSLEAHAVPQMLFEKISTQTFEATARSLDKNHAFVSKEQTPQKQVSGYVYSSMRLSSSVLCAPRLIALVLVSATFFCILRV
jgi:hypothetical protein